MVEGSMNSAERKVDWTKPIEAVHEDGRVVPAKVEYPPVEWDTSYGVRCGDGRYMHVKENGERYSPYYDDSWHIRNVAQPATTAIDPALVERMVALVREIADGQMTTVQVDEASSILAEIDPIDPDVAIAEAIAASFREGEYEAIALEALKRGRQLEREETNA